MASPRKIYWDACVWIALINGDEPWASRAEALIERARARDFEIWTSTLTLAEVYKKKVNGKSIAIPESHDRNFEAFVEQDFLVLAQLDETIGKLARRLLRSTSLNKPNDAIHLATAVYWDLDELHTADRVDLLPLNGKIKRKDGDNLPIVELPEVTGGGIEQPSLELDESD